MTRPCVYVLVSQRPAFLATCDTPQRAVTLARNVSRVLGYAAWVADWRQMAHDPRLEGGAAVAIAEGRL